ncbi:hypothetical protein TSAR_010344, partial [Trichomalopsis sarcophagae]
MNSENLITGMIAQLETRFYDYFNIEGVDKFAVKAALLHPRFKLSWVQRLSIEAQRKVEEITRTLIIDEEYRGTAAVDDEDSDNFYDFGTGSRRFLMQYLLISQQKGLNELMRFLQQPSKNLEILNDFSMVQKLFIQYNTPLPSVERLFSQASLLNMPKFNRLTDQNFERRVMVNVKKYKKRARTMELLLPPFALTHNDETMATTSSEKGFPLSSSPLAHSSVLSDTSLVAAASLLEKALLEKTLL